MSKFMSSRCRIINALFLVAAFTFLVYSLFPGRFDGDTIGQYQEGLNFSFQDAHSVMVAAALGLLAKIMSGPGPMFVLQLAIWLGGIALLTDTLIASGYRTTGYAVSIVALSPLISFDFVDVQSDAMLTALASLLTGFGARTLFSGSPPKLFAAIAAFVLLAVAIDVRNNGVFLIFPLWFLVWSVRHLRWRSFLIATTSGCLVFAAALFVGNTIDYRVLRAHRIHKVVMLIVFDLAAITVHTGNDETQGLLPNFVEKSLQCYTPEWWDPFLAGDCKDVFAVAEQVMFDDARRDLMLKRWGWAIARNPRAYLTHRLEHFKCLMRIGCHLPNPMTIGVSPIRSWDEGTLPRITNAALVMERWALE